MSTGDQTRSARSRRQTSSPSRSGSIASSTIASYSVAAARTSASPPRSQTSTARPARAMPRRSTSAILGSSSTTRILMGARIADRGEFILASSSARSVAAVNKNGTVVEARKLLKRYGEITAVDEVDVTVPTGDVYGLLGPNGAGKTTFMRMLFGLIRPDGGHIELFGRRELVGRVEALTDVAGFVETPRFYSYLSGRANLEILATLDRRDGSGAIDEALEQVDLADRANDRVREYSYGMVQRLGVAAALMRSPRLLVLDEPTNGLDPAGIRDMRALVRRLADGGITILLSSHNMLEVEEICRHVAIMRRGRLAFDGSMQELRARAEDVEYHLVTGDDALAAEVAERVEGVPRVTRRPDGVRFDSQPGPVERLTLELGARGVGIRQLELPTTALETLFFRLTETEAPPAEEVVA